MPGFDGLHVFLLVQDGSDIERFLKTLHERCWLAGFGWKAIGKSGHLLDRSIIDCTVGTPERLVFEGGPILETPLQQDRAARRPIATAGEMLDTLAACPPLSIAETARLKELKAREEYRMASAAAKVRSEYIEHTSRVLAKRKGLTVEAAVRIVKRSCAGILLPDLVLPFDDPELDGSTVADVLADPERFEGETLADPLEGVDYGVGKAKILRRPDGTPWIHSFAHGRIVYELKHDSASLRTAMEQLSGDAVVAKFIEMLVGADLSAQEHEQLRELAVERGKISKRALDQMVKAAHKEHAIQRVRQEQQRRAAERRDPRPQINNPPENEPWLPQMRVLNEVLGAVPELRPPARDIDSAVMRAKRICIPDTHAFTTADANAEPGEDD